MYKHLMELKNIKKQQALFELNFPRLVNIYLKRIFRTVYSRSEFHFVFDLTIK